MDRPSTTFGDRPPSPRKPRVASLLPDTPTLSSAFPAGAEDVDAVFKAMDKLYPLDKIEIEVNREEKEHRIVYEAAELPADAPAESFVAEMSVEKGADAVVFTWSVKAHGRGDADGDEANQWVASKYGDWDAAVKKAVA